MAAGVALCRVQVRGQRIHIRAYSFLDNRDTPEEIRVRATFTHMQHAICWAIRPSCYCIEFRCVPAHPPTRPPACAALRCTLPMQPGARPMRARCACLQLKPLEVSAKEGITEAELKGAALTLPLPEGVASVAGLPMSALRAALQPYTGFKNARRLHFHAPKAIWGGFEDPELEKEFNQVRPGVGLSCAAERRAGEACTVYCTAMRSGGPLGSCTRCLVAPSCCLFKHTFPAWKLSSAQPLRRCALCCGVVCRRWRS